MTWHPFQSVLRDQVRLHSQRSEQLSVLESHSILKAGFSERGKSTSGDVTVRASVGSKSL